MIERRTSRSPVPGEALRLYFQTLTERHHLAALTLANEDALLVAGAAAGSTPPLDLVTISALGCAGRQKAPLGGLVEQATGGRQLNAAEISIRGAKLYLAAVGGDLPASEDMRGAIERILDASLPLSEGRALS